MLIGFFKKPAECECCILKYVDRIWLSEVGDAEILRTFIVKVDENSPKPLKEIRLLIPHKHVENIENVTGNCFLPPSKCYYNSPDIYTTREYKIVRDLKKPEQFDSYGIINHDGIKGIKVFPSIDYSSYREGDRTVIRLQLPPKDGLKKGESTEIRIKFIISSIYEKIITGLFPIFSIELSYFPTLHVNKDIEQPDEKYEIKARSVLGLSKDNFKGGFDIFLYLPPEFEPITGFDSFKKKYDSYDIKGKKTSQKRIKLLWRLREFLKANNMPENSSLSTGIDIFISGTFTKPYNAKEVINLVSKKIPSGFWTKKINTSNLFSTIALILSIIAIAISIFYYFQK